MSSWIPEVPTKMRAAVLRGKARFAIEEVPVPEPPTEHVLVKIRYCGICGSDLHFWAHERTPVGSRLGHEFVGQVVRLGKGVTRFKVGDRVALGSDRPPAGHPWTAEQVRDPWALPATHPAAHLGGYAEYVVMHQWSLLPVPDSVSDEEAAVSEPFSIGLAAVGMSQMRPGDIAVVIGGGPIGLFTLLAAKLGGARQVVLTEVAAARADQARRLGADVVLNPREADVEAEVFRLTNGKGADVVLECAGAPSTLQQAANIIRYDGHIAVAGICPEPVTIEPVICYWKGLHIDFVCDGTVKTALDRICEKRVDVRPLVTDTVPLKEIQGAFERLLHAPDQVKVLVYP